MPKIAIFLTDLGGGGAERVMLNLANGFVRQDARVDMLLVNCGGPYLCKLDENINLIDLKSKRLIGVMPKLVRYLREETPDILITALEDTNLVAIFSHLLARVPTRIVVTVHNNLTQEAKNLKSLKRQIVPHFIRWIYPLSNLVIAVSKGVSIDLKNLGIQSEKIRVIYNPIITPDFYDMAQDSPIHPWFALPDIPIILGVGRLERQKDFETLIKAYHLVQKRQPCRLMILGEGSQYEKLLSLCKELNLSEENITFPGFVNNPFSYMAKASICVLSSAWEGFGNVLVESMGVGTPVVSTDCLSGPAEILEDGKYGILVPVGDAQAMSDAILRTLKNPSPKSILQQRAKDFCLDTILNEYQQALFS